MNTQVKEIVSEVSDRTAEEQFHTFFGQTPMEARNMLNHVVTVSRNIQEKIESQSDAFGDISEREKEKVFPAIQQLYINAQSSLEGFDTYLQFDPETQEYRIPDTFVQMTKAVEATNRITQACSSAKMGLDLHHVRDMAIMFAGLAGTAVLGEKVIFPAIDMVLGEE